MAKKRLHFQGDEVIINFDQKRLWTPGVSTSSNMKLYINVYFYKWLEF